MEWRKCFWCIFVFSLISVSSALINVELTVLQYDNPLGTSYVGNNSAGDRKCCDTGGGADCTSGNNTCDVFFVFCIGQPSNDPHSPGCVGSSIDMSASRDIYSINNGQNAGLIRYGNLSQWRLNQTSIHVQILDLDDITYGNRDSSIQPDLVDQFTRPLTFWPSPSYWNSTKHVIHLQKHASLDVQLRTWCADGWVGVTCNISCNHDDYHTCAASSGHLEPLLECADTDVLVLQMMVPIKKVATPAVLGNQLFQFAANLVCPQSTGNVSIELDGVRSTGLFLTDVLFHCKCDGTMVSRLKFQETLYVLGVIRTRLASPDAFFGVPIKSPAPKFIGSDPNQVHMLVQIRIISYENMAARNNCNRGTKGAYCDPRFMVKFDNNSVFSHITVNNADRFVDCNGALVDTDDRNTTKTTNSSYLFSLIQYPSLISIRVTDLFHAGNQIAAYGLPMNHVTVGSYFLDAQPHTFSGTVQNTRMSVEVMAWCSNCFTGNQCTLPTQNCNRSVTVVPPDCQSNADCIHGTCINSSCLCVEGWSGPKCNIDINECDLGYCQNSQTCHNTPGNYSCTCQTGFTGNTCDTDINECQSNPCNGGSFCLNTYGSFSCICSNGTVSENCFPDFCASNPCGNNGNCSDNMDGTYTCICHTGWTGQLCEENLNECQNNTNICQNGATCHDTKGSFYCECLPSFTGLKCESDVDECASVVCMNNGTCFNTFGGFYCSCTPHWTGPTCSDDVNECGTELDTCEKGECRNTNGSFHCLCLRGWTGANCSKDLDECHLEHNSPCFNGGLCINTQGSFQCKCPTGWTDEHCHSDVDECEDLQACNMNGNCTNTKGGYNCSCLTGWDGDECDVDIDECLIKNPCQHGSPCNNTQGGYNCTCPSNWTGNNCETDIDECLTSPCKYGGTCANNVGGYSCSCLSAWTGENCQDNVNECNEYTGLCANGGSCSDIQGDYTCTCTPGYTGKNCTTDIDECDHLNACKHHGECTNTDGSFTCRCPTSWTGSQCDFDVDECQEPDACSHHGNCVNEPGTFNCICSVAWTGFNCSTDVNECNHNPCLNGDCTNTPGSFTCTCNAGWKGDNCSANIDNCQDIDCNGHGTCHDLINNFNCQCEAGFSGNECEIDLDECATQPCLHGGSCTDHAGTYQCVCPPTWNGTNCERDVDECVTNPCEPTHQCDNTQGGFHCNFIQPPTTTQASIQTVTPEGRKSSQGTQHPILGNTDKQKSSIVPIAGGAAGGVILVIVVIIVIVFMRRRKSKVTENNHYDQVRPEESRDMNGGTMTMIHNPTYNTLYTEQSNI